MKPIIVPALGESVMDAKVGRWFVEMDQPIAEDAVIVELETDKVTLEVSAPASGVLRTVHFPKGSTVKIGDVLGEIEPSDISAEGMVAQTQGSDPMVVTNGPTNASAVEKQYETTVVTHPREERVPLSKLRQKIAERLKLAQQTAAILTTFNEIDMHAVMDVRQRLQASFQATHGVKLGFMSFFVKACTLALKEVPALNAEIDQTDIVFKKFYDIGVAVSTDRGLVVPVVRDADTLTFGQIEQTIAALSLQVREGTLPLQALTGGTFTITNGGVFGSLLSTPILNPPQCGILGMHAIQKRPVVIDDQIVIRPMMYVALSYDHRLVDGKEAVTFLVKIKEMLEDPERLLLPV